MPTLLRVVFAAVVLLTTSSLWAAYGDPDPFIPDHYVWYNLSKPKPCGQSIRPQLADQFLDRQFKVLNLIGFLNPVTKEHDEATTSIEDPSLHYSVYGVTGRRFSKSSPTLIRTQFGDLMLKKIGDPKLLFVPAAFDLTQKIRGPEIGANDHYLCYDVAVASNQQQPRASIVLDDPLADPDEPRDFVDNEGYSLLRTGMKYLCNPARKNAEESPHLTAGNNHLACFALNYKKRLAKGKIADQFISASISINRERFLCVPAVKLVTGADVCGDSIKGPDEECDDANLIDGDGCSSTCRLECEGQVEVCDGIDNDCDEEIDEGLSGQVCDTGQPGICGPGTTLCASQQESCVQNNQPTAETCNGLDDDCDGQVDEGNPGGGQQCQAQGQVGVCANGTTVCQNGQISCTPGSAGSETCNNLDDDCDGSTDEGIPSPGVCSTGQPGVCAAGQLTCQNGQFVCIPIQPASQETCNNLDDDCDASIDEDFPNKGQACTVGVGACEAAGIFVCKLDGTGTECSAVAGAPGSENDSVNCGDGLDNDCDGSTDCNDSDCTAFCNCVLDGTPQADIDSNLNNGNTPVVANQSTTNGGNDYSPPVTCANSNAPDLAYSWSAPQVGFYLITTQGSSYDTVLVVYEQPDCTTEVVCDDDGSGLGLLSRVCIHATSTDQNFVIVGDGFDTGSGSLTINIQSVNSCSCTDVGTSCLELEDCFDGVDNNGANGTDCDDPACAVPCQ